MAAPQAFLSPPRSEVRGLIRFMRGIHAEGDQIGICNESRRWPPQMMRSLGHRGQNQLTLTFIHCVKLRRIRPDDPYQRRLRDQNAVKRRYAFAVSLCKRMETVVEQMLLILVETRVIGGINDQQFAVDVVPAPIEVGQIRMPGAGLDKLGVRPREPAPRGSIVYGNGHCSPVRSDLLCKL